MSCISVNTSRVSGISAQALRLGGISAQANRIGGISVSVGIVCDIGVGRYLRVIPKEAQWITIDNPIDYNVISSVDWTVN